MSRRFSAGRPEASRRAVWPHQMVDQDHRHLIFLFTCAAVEGVLA
jgi:hypothetical protein